MTIPDVDSSNIVDDVIFLPVFDLKHVTVDETIAAIKRLSNSKSASLDGITAFMLKSCQTEISPVLTFMYNLSIRQRNFPKLWKISKVTPLHKGGCKDECNNYRPISIIPTVGKVLERLVHNQCTEYLSSHNVLSEAQSGFRGGRSTGTCLVDFLNTIYQGVNMGGVCGVVFLDLAKAFDTVCHELLIVKLSKLGFRYGASKWFESYLSCRYQCTVVEGRSSSLKQVECGVPQGSILGPLLFICYINDLPRQCTTSLPFIYADDTALLATGEDTLEVQSKLQNDLDMLSVWFAKNKLSVNCSKSNSMLFTSNRSQYKNDTLCLNIRNDAIEQSNEVKYLGLYVDLRLSFDSHVAKICDKLKVRTKRLWWIRSFISKDLAFTLYQSLIEPHLLYCNFILEGTSMINKQKLQVQQNNALRAVKCIKKRSSGTEIRQELGVDSVSTQMQKACCKFVYKGYYNLGPPSLNNMFELHTSDRNLRSNDQLQCVVPKCKTQYAERNLGYRGAIHWNGLPVEVKSATTSDNFKVKLKQMNQTNTQL